MVVRPLQPGDFPQWKPLCEAYLRFYRTRMSPAEVEDSWARLMEPGRDPHGLAWAADGRIQGFAHYLFHCSTWTSAPSCYLQDLFVAGDARGRGGARALIQEVYKRADEAGAGRVYWMTQEFNADARALYDTLANRTSFIQYRR